MNFKLFFFLLATTVAVLAPSTPHASSTPNQIHLLIPHSGSSGHRITGVDCLSWRLAVETNNIRNWKLVPKTCEDYVGHYMLGGQYRKDCDAVVAVAYEYAKGLNLTGIGKDIWVFDIDDTALSNIPYYARSDVAFGAIAFNETKFDAWVQEGIMPPVPAVLGLYKKLLSLGIKVIFLSGSSENYRETRISNLKKSGYPTWEKLILKKDSEKGTTSAVYKANKRKELEAGGYKIVGNMGDQWSDLIGNNVGDRTFKIPDPMYYIN